MKGGDYVRGIGEWLRKRKRDGHEMGRSKEDIPGTRRREGKRLRSFKVTGPQLFEVQRGERKLKQTAREGAKKSAQAEKKMCRTRLSVQGKTLGPVQLGKTHKPRLTCGGGAEGEGMTLPTG